MIVLEINGSEGGGEGSKLMAMPQRDDPPSLWRAFAYAEATAVALCASAIAKAFADKMAGKTANETSRQLVLKLHRFRDFAFV